jgi:hypothetical protein
MFSYNCLSHESSEPIRIPAVVNSKNLLIHHQAYHNLMRINITLISLQFFFVFIVKSWKRINFKTGHLVRFVTFKVAAYTRVMTLLRAILLIYGKMSRSLVLTKGSVDFMTITGSELAKPGEKELHSNKTSKASLAWRWHYLCYLLTQHVLFWTAFNSDFRPYSQCLLFKLRFLIKSQLNQGFELFEWCLLALIFF